jgi:hypothetical protein
MLQRVRGTRLSGERSTPARRGRAALAVDEFDAGLADANVIP